MNGTARATAYGYSLWEFQVFGAFGATGRLRHRQRGAGPPGHRVLDGERRHSRPRPPFDGNAGTRWSSAFSDPQWIQVDLGRHADRSARCELDLGGGVRHASFQIQVSANGTDAGRTISQHHHRHRRHADAQRHRHRPLRADERHRPGHRRTATRCSSSSSTPPAARRPPPPTADPPADPDRTFWGDTSNIPAAPERGHAQDPQPHQRPLPGQPGLLELQRADPLDRRAAVLRHAGQLGRPDVLLPRLARPASTSTSSSSPSAPSVFNGNTTRVDAFGLKLAMRLHAHDGYDVQVGEDQATFAEDRAVTFQKFINEVPAEFKRAGPDPGAVPDHRAGQRPDASGPAASTRTTSPRTPSANGVNAATSDIFGCAGVAGQRPGRLRRAQPARGRSCRSRSGRRRACTTRRRRRTTTPSSGTTTPSTSWPTASRTTTTPASPRSSRTATRSSCWSPSAGDLDPSPKGARLLTVPRGRAAPGKRAMTAIFIGCGST